MAFKVKRGGKSHRWWRNLCKVVCMWDTLKSVRWNNHNRFPWPHGENSGPYKKLVPPSKMNPGVQSLTVQTYRVYHSSLIVINFIPFVFVANTKSRICIQVVVVCLLKPCFTKSHLDSLTGRSIAYFLYSIKSYLHVSICVIIHCLLSHIP